MIQEGSVTISFWKNIQPFFSEKRKISNKITLVDNKEYTIKSVLLIISRSKNIPSFPLNELGLSEIERELNLIVPRKATKSNGIPPKLLKYTKTICFDTLKTIFNNCLITAEFPNELKLADVTSILKKEDPYRAKNYRPVSLLHSVSKIFEKILHRQVSSYVNQFLSALEKALVRNKHYCNNGKMEKYSWSKWIWWCNTYELFKGFWYY